MLSHFCLFSWENNFGRWENYDGDDFISIFFEEKTFDKCPYSPAMRPFLLRRH